MSKFEEILGELKNYDPKKNTWDFGGDYKKKFLKSLIDFTPTEKERINELLVAAVRTRSSNVCDSVYSPILEKRKLVDWKNKPEVIEEVFKTIIEECEAATQLVYFTTFVEKLMELIVSNQLITAHHATIFSIIKKSFTKGDDIENSIHPAALNCITKFTWGDYPELVVEAMRLVCEAVINYPDTSEKAWINTNLTIFLPMAFRVHTGGAVVKINGKSVDNNDQAVTTIHQILLEDVTKLVKFCANADFQYSEDPSQRTICATVLQAVLEDFLNNGNVSVEIIRPMYATILELRECGDTYIERDAGYIVTAMAGNTELTSQQTPQLLEEFLQNKLQIGHKIPDMYKGCPEAFYPLLSRFEPLLADSSYPYIYMICQLFNEVAKDRPEEIKESVCQKMVALLQHDTAKYATIPFFEALASSRPEMAKGHDLDLINCMNKDELTVGMVTGVLVKLATDDATCEKYLAAMAARIPSVKSQRLFVVSVIYNMRLIGLKNPKLLEPHLPLFLQLKEEAVLKDACQSAIDVIEGRSLETVSKEVSDQRKDIDDIDARLVDGENKMDQLEGRIEDGASRLVDVENEVGRRAAQLDDLETTVERTAEKVEELDHKTLSHAPSWSRDVAILMNEKNERDWRLLAFRMGYNAEDIRNWATQPNATLSLLDEWFATHKTREATYAVLQMLIEMDRKDASAIVQKALDDVADVVQEEEPEPLHPPPIFISYQWAHQNEARLLKKHLEMAGYPCWMDIGQMGGGDKLYSKIDAGLRAAKVVVSCVTQRYAESPNCIREVNLSVTLGKPIIPLLFEKMAWPPAGSMGPIFGEYLFVRFYQRPEETLVDDRFWPADFFNQLLMQIRYNVAPDTAMIQPHSPYNTWWKPPEEIIVIRKKRNSQVGLPQVESPDRIDSPTLAPPQVFISYQWDKQPQIKNLYRKLTEEGYSCWLDILQMGGGDSLYDKIDKGIRGCRVVVSCVTQKYALSANCRREVSLTDAVKKPVIPLLLEKMSWPPEGPMGMILAPILYVDFSKNAENSSWDDQESFNQLLAKLNESVKADGITKSADKAKPKLASKPISPLASKPLSPLASKPISPLASKPLSPLAPTPTSPKPAVNLTNNNNTISAEETKTDAPSQYNNKPAEKPTNINNIDNTILADKPLNGSIKTKSNTPIVHAKKPLEKVPISTNTKPKLSNKSSNDKLNKQSNGGTKNKSDLLETGSNRPEDKLPDIRNTNTVVKTSAQLEKSDKVVDNSLGEKMPKSGHEDTKPKTKTKANISPPLAAVSSSTADSVPNASVLKNTDISTNTNKENNLNKMADAKTENQIENKELHSAEKSTHEIILSSKKNIRPNTKGINKEVGKKSCCKVS